MERISVDQSQSAPIQSSTSDFASTLQKEKGSMNMKVFGVLAVIVIVLGIGSGYAGAAFTTPVITQQTMNTGDEQSQGGEQAAAVQVKVGQVVGAKDASSFKDSAEGVLLPGGIGSEGSHHIARPGGQSQNVYLTSSVMDLKLFENARVKVSGETFKAQKAGWLMDVGRLEVLELNAPLPDGTKPVEKLMGDE